MKISSKTYDLLLNTAIVPPETGGIIGGKNFLIDNIIFDSKNSSVCNYIPNIVFINSIIKNWYDCGIEFYGIFHTHAPQWSTLSKEDILYINRIMKNMPESINSLLFPLVFPKEKIKWYKAEIISENVYVTEIDIEVI